MRIFIEDSFDSAHSLPNVRKTHKCYREHGHTYRIHLEFCGEVDEMLGWIVDYADVKAVWEPIKRRLDHHRLNEFIPNPTCELIAKWIVLKFQRSLPPQAELWRVELRETEHCGVVWELIRE